MFQVILKKQSITYGDLKNMLAKFDAEQLKQPVRIWLDEWEEKRIEDVSALEEDWIDPVDEGNAPISEYMSNYKDIWNDLTEEDKQVTLPKGTIIFFTRDLI